VSGTDFGDRTARNRDTGKPTLSLARVGGLREWERALRPFGA